MARKRKPQPEQPVELITYQIASGEAAAARRGRPPGEPKTALARWIQHQGITVTDFATELRKVADKVGISAELVPETKTLRDIVNMRHRASLETVVLVRHATGGAVDLDQWVEDLSAG